LRQNVAFGEQYGLLTLGEQIMRLLSQSTILVALTNSISPCVQSTGDWAVSGELFGAGAGAGIGATQGALLELARRSAVVPQAP
jgi:hypothetical protein